MPTAQHVAALHLAHPAHQSCGRAAQPGGIIAAGNLGDTGNGNRLATDQTRAVAAVEQGHDVTLLHNFLITTEDQPLPDSVEAFIKAVAQQGGALKTVASAELLECASAEIAQQIAAHKETAKLCLAVRTDHTEKFRTTLHILGFGWRI